MNHKQWKRICLAADGLPGFEAWAAISDGELAGALFTARIADTVFVPYALSRSKYLHEHVNNVLFFKACTNILERDGVSSIFFTVQSLDAPESVDEFKIRMSFTPKPVRQRVVLNPLITPLATNLGYTLLRCMVDRYRENNFLSKAEGMVRFNKMGKLPLSEQKWPECVASYKDWSGADKMKDVTKESSHAILPAALIGRKE